MPANLTPQYRAADAKFRAAHSLEEKKAGLEEMLATLPKHKGTEKMQADLKRRLARLRQEEEARTSKHGHAMRVEPAGVAQVMLLGPPNAGKSSLLAALTHAEPAIADYPFTTTHPQPGTMPYEDVHIQLVDLPPVTSEHMDPWMANLVRGADAAVLFMDPTSKSVPEDVEELRERFAAVHIPIVGRFPADGDPRDMPLPSVIALTKVDLAREEDLKILEEMYASDFAILRISVASRAGLEPFKVALWRHLELVRLYAKPPGKPVDRHEPFVLPLGATVVDLAERIHRELAEGLQFARVWGGKLDGQRVARDFELRDRDVVELHF